MKSFLKLGLTLSEILTSILITKLITQPLLSFFFHFILDVTIIIECVSLLIKIGNRLVFWNDLCRFSTLLC